jgi:hypothetical protein
MQKWYLLKTVPGIGVGGMEERSGGGGIQVWCIWYIVRTFVNATMYPHPAQWFFKMGHFIILCILKTFILIWRENICYWRHPTFPNTNIPSEIIKTSFLLSSHYLKGVHTSQEKLAQHPLLRAGECQGLFGFFDSSSVTEICISRHQYSVASLWIFLVKSS